MRVLTYIHSLKRWCRITFRSLIARQCHRRGEIHSSFVSSRWTRLSKERRVRLYKRHIIVLASSGNCLVSAQHLTRNKLYAEVSIGIARTARIIHWILISPSVRAICICIFYEDLSISRYTGMITACYQYRAQASRDEKDALSCQWIHRQLLRTIYK